MNKQPGLCGGCRFFDELETQMNPMDGGGEGRCRRLPPQLDPNYERLNKEDVDYDGSLDAAWYVFPIVFSGRDWCGEFKAKK